MIIIWKAVSLASLDAALVGASAVDKSVGGALRARLVAAGAAFDAAFAHQADLDAWLARVATYLRDLDAFAALCDGGPPTLIDPANPLAARPAITKRIAAAATSNADSSKLQLLTDAQKAPSPLAETVVDSHRPSFNGGATKADTVQRVLDAIDGVTAWLSVAT